MNAPIFLLTDYQQGKTLLSIVAYNCYCWQDVDWYWQIVNKAQQIGLARHAGQSGWGQIGIKISRGLKWKYFPYDLFYLGLVYFLTNVSCWFGLAKEAEWWVGRCSRICKVTVEISGGQSFLFVMKFDEHWTQRLSGRKFYIKIPFILNWRAYGANFGHMP